MSDMLLSPCLAFNPPKLWCVQPLCNEMCLRNVYNRQVFAGIYPIESNDFPKLEESIKRVQWFVDINRMRLYITFYDSLH
jgi:hypothetical protein